MKKNYLLVLLLVQVAFFLNIKKAHSQIIISNPYPTPAESITRGFGSGLLTVDIAFTSNCTSDTVTICMPESVTYVAGTVTKTGGTQTISEGDISNLRKPQFVISNVSGTGDIRFTIARSASCGSLASGKDTVLVKGSCGSATENGGAVNTYNLLAPSLSLSPPAAITGAIIGTSKTRTISVTNGGNGDADTVFFYIVYPNGGVTNTTANAITANGTSFSPFRIGGDTLFYRIFGSTLFGGNNLLTNGESITINEPMEVAECNAVTTYGAGWGTNNTNICTWATGTASIAMAGGVPNLTSVTRANVGYIDRCTPYDINFTATNGGTGNDTSAGMYNIRIEHGYVYPGRTIVQPYNAAIMTYSNARINGNAVTFTTTGNIVNIDLNDVFPTTGADPDGPGGLADLDGDGFYDDLPRGEAVTYTLNLAWTCNLTCGRDKIEYTGARIHYDNMCRISQSSVPQHSYRPVYESSFTGTAYVPANIIGGQPFRIELKEGHYINSYINSGANTRYEWALKLPAGYSVSGGGAPTYGGVATTYVQSNDTIFITSTNNSLRDAAIDLVLTCGSGGTTTFSYALTKIDDITTGCRCAGNLICATVNATAFCPSPCPAGPANQVPMVRRVDGSLGWTDNTLSTRQSAASISAYDLSKALYLDTIQITGSAIQSNAASNLHLELNLDRIGTTVNKLSPLDIQTQIFRAGILISSGTTTLFTDNSSGTLQVTDWDVSGALPGGGLFASDSIVTVSRYVVATNSGLPQNDVQSGGRFFHYNLVAGVKEYCTDPVPEMYLVGTVALDGRNAFYTSGCNITALGGGGSHIARRFNTSGELYANEFRPVMYIDSVVINKPAGYDLIEVANNFGGGVMVANQVNGDVYSYYNPGTWRALGLTVTNTYGGNVTYKVQPTCSTLPTATHGIKIYIKDFYYAYAGSGTNPPSFSYILGGGSGNTASQTGYRNQTVNYSSINKPIPVMQNLTGVVIGTAPQHYWDVEVKNDGLSNMSNTWISLEKMTGSGISIDSVVLQSSGSALTPNNYGVGNAWYEVSTAGIPSAGTETVRIYFKYTNCTEDSILVSTGWNCGGYPSPDPDTDPNACSLDQLYAKVVPNESQIQLSVTRQPGNGSDISLCTTDSILVQLNSAQSANVINPRVDIFPPSGVNIIVPPTGILVEYPLASGIYENATTTGIPGGYRVDISSHSGIGGAGVPGLISNPGAAGRQAKLKIEFTTDCNHTSGSSMTFRIYGDKPCGGLPAIGNGATVRSNGINITGASVSGGMGATMTLSSSSMTCGETATIPFTATPVTNGTQAGDTAIYTLPANLSYGGNFTPGTNCTACEISSSAGPGGTTIVKVKLDPGIAANNTLEYSFDIAAKSGAGCGSESILVEFKRDIPPLFCVSSGMNCPSSSVIIGRNTTPIEVTFPDLSITSYSGNYISYSPAYTYSYSGIIQNSSANTPVAQGTSTVLETWFDMDKNNAFDSTIDQRVHVQTLTDSIGRNNDTRNFIDTFSWSDGVNPPDPTRAMFTVIRNSTSPNCMCNAIAASPMVAGLPVSWSKFTATKKGNSDVLLDWTTEMERSSSHFEVQRRFSYQSDFSTLANVNGAGTSFAPQNYTYTDKHNETFSNIVLYRIKQVDLNGKEDFSPIRTIRYSNQGAYFSISPNPAKSKVSISTSASSPFQYRLMDAASHIIASGRCTDGSCEIDLTNVSAGIYFVSVKNELGVSHIEKLVVSE